MSTSYPDFVDKAAVLLVRLVKNHPLPDGNKRAAWVSMFRGRRRDLDRRRALPPERRRYPVGVENRDVLTAAELDELSPSERAQAVRDGVVEDLDQLPGGFRRRVEATARRLSADLNQSVSE
jgi:Fic family protein